MTERLEKYKETMNQEIEYKQFEEVEDTKRLISYTQDIINKLEKELPFLKPYCKD